MWKNKPEMAKEWSKHEDNLSYRKKKKKMRDELS